MAIHSETDTVVKRILPYLCCRGYDIKKDIDFEPPTKQPEKYSKGYIDLLVTCGDPRPVFLIEAKRTSRVLNAPDPSGDRLRHPRDAFVMVTSGHDFRPPTSRPRRPSYDAHKNPG